MSQTTSTFKTTGKYCFLCIKDVQVLEKTYNGGITSVSLNNNVNVTL